MKPPVSHEAVFNGTGGKSERLKRARSAATIALDALVAPKHYNRSKGNERAHTLDGAERALALHSDTLRNRYKEGLSRGMVFRAPTEEGASITATATSHETGIADGTAWRIKIDPAKGKSSEFVASVRTNYRGSIHGHERTWVQVSTVDTETGKAYAGYKYGDQGHAEATMTAATALQRLEDARQAGDLVAFEMPAGVLSQQPPELVH